MVQELKGLDTEKLRAYCCYNVKLTTFTMVVWFVVTYVCSYFVKELNSIVFSLFLQHKGAEKAERRPVF